MSKASAISKVFCLLLFAFTVLPFSSASKTNTLTQQGTQALSTNQEQARQALDQGVQAFKSAQFDEAVEFFKRAKELDSTLPNAGLYLATAYASQYIPGAPSEENVHMGKLATETYKEVLEKDPQNLSAIDGLASILYQRAGQPFDADMFIESKSYHQKHIDLQPQDPEPYYTIGVTDWALSYHANTKLRQEFNQTVGGEGLHDDEPLPEVLRNDYVREYGAMIDEGIHYLNRAIQLKPDYEDAMTYLNLLYRRKADTVDSMAERERLTQIADELLDSVREIKQKRASDSN